jgi:hypothetical protein
MFKNITIAAVLLAILVIPSTSFAMMCPPEPKETKKGTSIYRKIYVLSGQKFEVTGDKEKRQELVNLLRKLRSERKNSNN